MPRVWASSRETDWLSRILSRSRRSAAGPTACQVADSGGAGNAQQQSSPTRDALAAMSRVWRKLGGLSQ